MHRFRKAMAFLATGLLSFALTIGSVRLAIAAATLSIAVPNESFQVNSGVHAFPIFVTGSIPIHSYDLLMQVGNGSGSDGAPTMTYAGYPTDSTNSNFSSSGHLFTEEGSNAWNVTFGLSLSATGANIPANTNGGGGAGLLATLLINTNGAQVGDYELLAGGANANNGNSDFASSAGGVPVLISNGLVNITAVPEPSSLLLSLVAIAGLTAVAIHKRRARRLA